MEKIVLIGGGGHAASVADTLLSTQAYEVVGITDASVNPGQDLLGIPYLGSDEVLPEIFRSGVKYAFITVGSIGTTSLRTKLFHMAKQIGFRLPVIMDPTAIVGKGCKLSEGVFIGKGAVINALSEVGEMAILNSRSLIEHGCQVGGFCHIAPGTALGGEVTIGSHTHIGISSTVIQGVKVGHHSLIGAGSVVVGDIGDNKKAYGNPCREVDDFYG